MKIIGIICSIIIGVILYSPWFLFLLMMFTYHIPHNFLTLIVYIGILMYSMIYGSKIVINFYKWFKSNLK